MEQSLAKEYVDWLVISWLPYLISLAKIFGGMVFFLLLEHFFPAERNQDKWGMLTNILMSLCQLFVTFFTTFFTGMMVVKTVSYFGGPWVHLDMPAILSGYTGITKIFVGGILYLVPLVIFDFFYYWFHRCQHQVGWLWLEHKFHHADLDMNTTTVHRHHWLEEIIRSFLILIPMGTLIKLDPIEISVVAFVLVYWGHFFHSNLRLHLGALGLIFTGPQVHRIHHSILPHHRNKNFAAFFPAWDIIFGTFYSPKANEFPPTGVEGEPSRPRINYYLWEPILGIIRPVKSIFYKFFPKKF